MPTGVYKRTEEHKAKISQAHIGMKLSLETRRKISENKKGNKNCLGRKPSENVKRKISQSLIGHSFYGLRHYPEVIKEKIRQKSLGRIISKEQRIKQSLAQKRNWALLSREEAIDRIRKSTRRPNYAEQKFYKFLDSNFPNEWIYNGNADLIIGGKVPDFVNINGRKCLIELFGDYWHKPDEIEERIHYFCQYGYSTLIIWVSDFYRNPELIKEKILSFVAFANINIGGEAWKVLEYSLWHWY